MLGLRASSRAQVAAAALALALTGCGRAQIEDSQVIARVNSDDISVHQLNFAIGQASGKVRSTVEREALREKIIDRQLALQQALERKLDRRPEVMLRLEEARRDILAAAYAEELSRGMQVPSENASARYYAEHPGLFANRKIYRLREIAIPADSPALAEAQARLERKERMAEVLVWLQQQPGRYSDQLALRPAEQLPIEIVDRLSRIKSGESIAFRLPRALLIYELQSAEPVPMSWAAAAPIIKAHLIKQQDAAALEDELKRLRSGAKIIRTRLAD